MKRSLNDTTVENPKDRAGFQARRAIVTGTGGLGLEAAKALAQLGAEVTIAGRNPEKGAVALREIQAVASCAPAEFERLDLADLGSVRAMVSRLEEKGQPLDILVNNAGIMSPPHRRLTADGFEAQFGTNHLGHFALTLGLLPLLRKSSSARVVHVTSLAHKYGQLDFSDLQNARKYKAGVAYCQSKLAVALFARELQRRADESSWPLLSIAAHPGFATTNLFAAEHGANSLLTFLGMKIVGPLVGQSARQGAEPIIQAATSPDAQGGGLYGPTGFMEMKGAPGECAFGRAALNEETARRLWQESELLTGMKA